MNELVEALRVKMEEARATMQCDCGGKHRRYATKRPPAEARHCRRCKELHAARENDIWAESHWLGFLWYYYACMDGVVYDITEWAACERNLLKHIKPDSHLVPFPSLHLLRPFSSYTSLPFLQVQYRLITGKNAPLDREGMSGRGSSRQRPPTEAEMEALLSRFLDDRPGAGGGPSSGSGLTAGFGAPPGGVSSSASYRPPPHPASDTGRPRKAGRRRKK